MLMLPYLLNAKKFGVPPSCLFFSDMDSKYKKQTKDLQPFHVTSSFPSKRLRMEFKIAM
jgi:hypothetical protein